MRTIIINKTKIFITLLLLCSITLKAQQNWNSQVSGTNQQLNSVFFINSLTGWIVGYNGTILTTSNGGLNWVSQNSASQDSLYSVIFINHSLNGWVCGSDGLIEFTSNGGLTWNIQQNSPAILTLYSMTYDGFTVYASGIEHSVGPALEKSTNLGAQWNIAVYGLSSSNIFYSVNSPSISSGWIVTGAGRIFHFLSTFALTEQLSGVVSALYSVSFVNSSTGFIVGANGVILKTTNAAIWTAQQSQTTDILRSVYFTNPSSGWVVGNSGKILSTTNGGNTWSPQTSNLTATLRSVFFANDTTGWAVGDSGKILSTINQNVTGIKSNTHNITPYFSLSQNYPNPFNPDTKIEYTINKSGYVTLKIFNVQGKEVKKLIEQNQNPGSYQLKFEGKDYPSGVYFYKLTSGGNSEIRKMILLK